MGIVEHTLGPGRTWGRIEHTVRLAVRRWPVMVSAFSGQSVVPDVVEALWVCCRAWGPWELEAVWVEGAVVRGGGLRDGLLYADCAVGAECDLAGAPRWVRAAALRTWGMGTEVEAAMPA